VKLARAPGMREQRWAHLLCGPVEIGAYETQALGGVSLALEARIEALENEVTALRSTVQNLCEQLGMSQPGQAK